MELFPCLRRLGIRFLAYVRESASVTGRFVAATKTLAASALRVHIYCCSCYCDSGVQSTASLQIHRTKQITVAAAVHKTSYNPLAAGLLTGKHRFDEDPAAGRFKGNSMYMARFWNKECVGAFL
jgi:hypothetical protein